MPDQIDAAGTPESAAASSQAVRRSRRPAAWLWLWIVAVVVLGALFMALPTFASAIHVVGDGCGGG